VDRRTIAAYIVQVLVWGTTWAAIKVGVTDVPPWIFAFDRSVLVATSLAAVALILHLRFPSDRRTFVAAAISGGINSGVSWAIIFWAEQVVPSGLVSVFGASGPIWTGLLAHFLVKGDRLSATKVMALALGFGGIAVLVGTSGEIAGSTAVFATILCAIMPVGWGVAAIVMSRTLTTVSPIPAISIGSATGAVFLIPFALSELSQPARWTPEAIGALLYLSWIGSGVGLVLNLWLYRRLRPTTIALAQLLITVEAVLVGAVALHENVTLGMLAGAVLVLTAIALNARAAPRFPPQPSLPEQAAATPAE
jgi:drug/metabolite transporter (DMT)-like permease